MPTKLEYEHVAQLLDYDPESGSFTWKFRNDRESSWNARYAGTVAGSCKSKAGRRINLKIDKRMVKFLTRKIAFFILTKTIPDVLVVMNGDPMDDTATNIISGSKQLAAKKRKLGENSNSKILGVRLSKAKCKSWVAEVTADGVTKKKTFKTRDAAESWVKERRLELGFDPDLHGRK